MTQVIEHPSAVKIRHQNFWIDAPDGSFGPGLDGGEQTVYSENRVWMGQVVLPDLTQGDALIARAFGDQLRGRANVWRMPIINNGTPRYLGDEQAFYAEIGVPADDVARGYIPYHDDAAFADGSGFALPDHEEPTVSAAAAIGAEVVQLDGYLGRNLAVGAFFADALDYAYRVVENLDGQVRFNPPLRAPVVVGDRIEVTAPHIQVRLADKKQMRIFQEYCDYGRSLKVQVTERLER